MLTKSIFDRVVDFTIQIGLFDNGIELHSFLMGGLLPYACLGIAIFDRRVAALVFGSAILTGYSSISPLPSTGVIDQKPLYFIIGSCCSSIFVYLILNRSHICSEYLALDN